MIDEKLYNGGGHAHRGLNILMVDDDEVCLFIHRRVLELSGCCSSTRSAANGKSALEILKAVTGDIPFPDIILLDLEMPVMNGIAFLEAFRRLDFAQKSHIAIVLLTSSVSENDKNYAMSLGASYYLAKPFTMAGFHSVIHALNKNCSPSSLSKNNFVTQPLRNTI